MTTLMMYSVEPLQSARATTSRVHSGCTTTRTPGCCSRAASTCSGRKRPCTEQCPFQSKKVAFWRASGVLPPRGLPGAQTAVSSRV